MAILHNTAGGTVRTPQRLGKEGSGMKSGRQEKAGKAEDALPCAARARSPAPGCLELPIFCVWQGRVHIGASRLKLQTSCVSTLKTARPTCSCQTSSEGACADQLGRALAHLPMLPSIKSKFAVDSSESLQTCC